MFKFGFLDGHGRREILEIGDLKLFGGDLKSLVKS